MLCVVPSRGKALLHHLGEVLCQAAAELLLIMANFTLNKLLISSSVMERLIRLGQERGGWVGGKKARDGGRDSVSGKRWRGQRREGELAMY